MQTRTRGDNRASTCCSAHPATSPTSSPQFAGQTPSWGQHLLPNCYPPCPITHNLSGGHGPPATHCPLQRCYMIPSNESMALVVGRGGFASLEDAILSSLRKLYKSTILYFFFFFFALAERRLLDTYSYNASPCSSLQGSVVCPPLALSLNSVGFSRSSVVCQTPRKMDITHSPGRQHRIFQALPTQLGFSIRDLSSCVWGTPSITGRGEFLSLPSIPRAGNNEPRAQPLCSRAAGQDGARSADDQVGVL